MLSHEQFAYHILGSACPLLTEEEQARNDGFTVVRLQLHCSIFLVEVKFPGDCKTEIRNVHYACECEKRGCAPSEKQVMKQIRSQF